MTVTIATYLEDVIDERIVPMLKEVSAAFTLPVEQVTRTVNANDTPPFWWVYTGGLSPSLVAAARYTELVTVNLRLVLAHAKQTGYEGQYEGYLWTWLPTVSRYFQERRALVYQAGQSVPDYLEPKDVAIGDFTPFGVFDDFGHIGVETVLTLPFSFYITSYPGNP